ncbi:MAG: tRNA (adenosine(37)-N6)-threonylcarbamoyltransferase complex dimerization subunit type 1 TsaB [Gammaproteobacteria bacterium]|nr:tRNA (adenosine(37)-N6)-threonylcarbamoyltransferase complex dimerization subunit type 1 TsaB [Gammaproteobacteria bacterium]MDH5652794.1 tRNA (adenosine(37)-N6)-threonylcarbamoyltransferase complex dimerization subunit type 1 TsaB [Gammaproteobacteria bacterium]
MKYLAIDASTEACSVALQVGSECLSRHLIAPRGHARYLLGMVDEVLQEAGLKPGELDGLVFDRGPGSFTGVRISTSVCQGLAFGAQLPVVGVSSLAGIAQGRLRERGETAVAAVIDARMGEVYAGWFREQKGIMQACAEEWIGPADTIAIPDQDPWYGAGSGWHAYRKELSGVFAGQLSGVDAECLPMAKDLLTLAIPCFLSGRTLTPEQVLPTYLRNEVTWKQSGV